MDLAFDEITIEYFRSFRKRTTFRFSELDYGLYYVRGENTATTSLESNGAGKTTFIAHAVFWCLYGQTVNGLRSTDIGSWQNPSEMTSVALTLSIDDEPYTIERTAHPNSLSLNGKEVGQPRIESLLGLSSLAFSFSLLYGQGEDLFFDLTPSNMMKILVDVLTLERWDERSKRASDLAGVLQRQLIQIESDITARDRELQTALELAKTLKQDSAEWEQERAGQIKIIEERQKELRKALEKAQPEHDDADLAYDGAKTELKTLDKQLDDLQIAQTKRNRNIADARVKVEVQKSGLEALRKRQKDIKAKVCPECGQPLKKGHSYNYLELIEQGETNLSLLEGTLAEIRSIYAEKQRQMENLAATRKIFVKKEDDARLILDRHGPLIASWKTESMQLEKSKTNYLEGRNPYRDQLNATMRRISELTNQLHDDEGEKLKADRKLHRATYWVKGFKEVRLYIVEDLLAEMELVANALLEQFGLIGWKLQYQIEKETKSGTMQRGLNVMVLSPDNTKPVRWEVWSGGESQRLRLVGSLALSEILLHRAGIIPDFEVLDEPTRGLSHAGNEGLCEVLAERAKRLSRRIFYIDHQSVESSRFKGTILVRKTKAGSSISMT